MALLALLAACTDAPYLLDTGSADTGVPQCGRIRGTEGILLYQDGGDTVRSPTDTPNGYEVTTGVAGPLGDDRSYLAIVSGQAIFSADAGCNWEERTRLPATGTWRLVSARSRVYAFDSATASGARTDDLGLTWSSFSTGEAFTGLPSADPADSGRLRGVQARGVVTSTDGGDTWSVTAPLPDGATGPTDATVAASDTNILLLGSSAGAWRTSDGGGTWDPIGTDAIIATAIHPDDASVFFVQSSSSGTTTLWRTENRGDDWGRLTDSAQLSLAADARLWPVPGNTSQVLSAYGPRYNENTDSDGVNLYVVEAGTGTHTLFIGTWFHIHQVTFGADRWVAGVDAVATR